MIIAEYKTVSAVSSKELDNVVNRNLKMGFQPFGTPYVVGAGSHQTIYQALVRSEDSALQVTPEAKADEPKIIMPPPPRPSA